MEINANVKAVAKIDIEPEEAFRMFCRSLKMDCVDAEKQLYTENKPD